VFKVYKVRMQSKSGSELFAAASGHASDWVHENAPEPEAVLETRDAALALAALVEATGYAKPQVIELTL